jgi:RNA polymerase sigma-70 factor (ECF subfamily)
VSEQNDLAAQFEAHRAHLRGVAYRMLGSLSEADDAVQEAWLRLSRAEAGEVTNLGGWLTTVVARVCLDMLRARKARRASEADTGADVAESSAAAVRDTRSTAEEEAEMADSIGLALMVVLRTLAPAERIAFVLHDMFDLSFDDIAPIVGRSSTATRQLASRARRRVQGTAKVAAPDLAAQRQIVDQFLTASRNGDLDALLAVLDPEVVLRADRVQLPIGPAQVIHGAADVARFFSGRARSARPALINGGLGVVVAPQGRLLLVLNVSIENGRIVALEAISDPERLASLELAALE